MNADSDDPHLEGPITEQFTLEPPGRTELGQPSGWWAGYQRHLQVSMSETAMDVVAEDSAYIVRSGILGAGPAGSADWPLNRVRKGLVMGAVQSGKTASMFGVAAQSLDAGVDVIVVLAGTRTALWQQTYARLTHQLMGRDGYEAPNGRALLLPSPASVRGAQPSPQLADLYRVNRAHLRRAVGDRQPIVIVAMKNVHHLRALASILQERLPSAIEAARRPLHMVVLDDEADDASILDARLESGLDPASDDLKQVPRAIVDLWDPRPRTGATSSPDLYVTYIAYTATPQANFLQAHHNPLAPTEFVIALRTPFDRGALAPRATTYREPLGLARYYTGGESYYQRLPKASPCVTTTGSPDEDIAEAMRAYLVASAVRIWSGDPSKRLSAVRDVYFDSRAAAAKASPPPQTMLIHPSPSVADQFEAAALVVSWSGGLDLAGARAQIEAGSLALPTESLVASLLEDEGPWMAWLERFTASAHALRDEFDLADLPPLPTADEWPSLRSILLAEVLPFVRLAVINSDNRAEHSPRFEPQQVDGRGWSAATDLLTIFVSGNVMSRGLTLEGLTTTLFLRSSEDAYADTQMQMQRWFGYRGAYLHLCRVFLSPTQRSLFSRYHDTDEALRRSVIALMNENPEAPPSPTVLQGADFGATGKIASISNVPLWPGPAPFVRLVNEAMVADPNVEVVHRAFLNAPSSEVVANGMVRGRILNDGMSLLEAASFLDELRYAHHRPSAEDWEGLRWRSAELHAGLDRGPAPQELPLFRPPAARSDAVVSAGPGSCPYAIAAYLRLWSACLTRRARGMFPTENPEMPWSLLDLEERRTLEPRFFVGIRYGAGGEVTSGPLSELPFPVRCMQRDIENGRLSGTWGSRNPSADGESYLGDALFDYHHHGATPPPRSGGELPWRRAGSPGLILFHVVENPTCANPAVAVGLGIPLGGPDQFAAKALQ